MTSGSGSVMNSGSWAPQRAAERNGPSAWIPATWRRIAGAASASNPEMRRAAASRSSAGAVTRLSSVVVVPWLRWNRHRRRRRRDRRR